jgi:hypothetical protein
MDVWQRRSDAELWETVSQYVQVPPSDVRGVSVGPPAEASRESIGNEQTPVTAGPTNVASLHVSTTTEVSGRPRLPVSASPQDLVTAAELSEWRRSLIRLLRSVDTDQAEVSTNGPSERIHRLCRDGILPRDLGALMRLVTEMRNSTEYESKVLSVNESAAVRSAWSAISEWAEKRTPKP